MPSYVHVHVSRLGVRVLQTFRSTGSTHAESTWKPRHAARTLHRDVAGSGRRRLRVREMKEMRAEVPPPSLQWRGRPGCEGEGVVLSMWVAVARRCGPIFVSRTECG